MAVSVDDRMADKLDRATFDSEIRMAGRPVILRGLAKDWPAVHAARQSSQALGAYLQGHDAGLPVDVAFADKDLKGQFFYNDDLSGLNYQVHKRKLSALIGWCLSVMGKGEVESVYMQAQPVDQLVPRMAAELPMPLLGETVRPRLWLGNTLRTQTHFDYDSNIAVHVAGEKTFTLFAPDQTGNLYAGPFDRTPAGVPISMASLEAPDFDRFPRLAQALDHALKAELEPGDGLFIPPLWWHHVQTTGPLNMLVNYWWNDNRVDAINPVFALRAAALAYRDMPTAQREAWREMLNVFVFDDKGDPVAHLPENLTNAFRSRMDPHDMAILKQRLLRG